MSSRLSLKLLSLAAMFAAGSADSPRALAKRGQATMIPRNHAARTTKSRRSACHTRPALPLGTRENARRVRQMARGILRTTTG